MVEGLSLNSDSPVPVPVPGKQEIAFHWMARVLHGGVDGSTPIGRSILPSRPLAFPVASFGHGHGHVYGGLSKTGTDPRSTRCAESGSRKVAKSAKGPRSPRERENGGAMRVGFIRYFRRVGGSSGSVNMVAARKKARTPNFRELSGDAVACRAESFATRSACRARYPKNS